MIPQEMMLEDGSRTTVVHLAVLRDSDGVLAEQCWRIACAPRMPDLSCRDRAAPVLRSDDPRSVTCPVCQKTDEYHSVAIRSVGKPAGETVVHLIVQVPDPDSLLADDVKWETACGLIGTTRSDDPRAVNCNACKHTWAYDDLMKRVRMAGRPMV